MTRKTEDKKQSSKGFGTTNYPVGDFFARVKNAVLAHNKTLKVINSKSIKKVAQVLEKEGYLDQVEEKEGELYLSLTYYKKEPLLLDLKVISKPGLRVYMGADELEGKKGPSIYIVSTPKGIMTSKEAIKRRLGGEVIAEVS